MSTRKGRGSEGQVEAHSASMIDGVAVKRLTVHADDRGYLMEVVRDDDPVFREVKQTTFTVAYPGVIKAFHWHRRQWDVWFFASGMAQAVLYDLREGSPTCGRTDVLYMGERRPLVVAIPPGVAHGYRVLGPGPAALFYHTTERYDPASPDEERIPHDDPRIGFDWQTKNR
jgi:dTDP-4-dehydrorhamnose 3,5-epimerase